MTKIFYLLAFIVILSSATTLANEKLVALIQDASVLPKESPEWVKKWAEVEAWFKNDPAVEIDFQTMMIIEFNNPELVQRIDALREHGAQLPALAPADERPDDLLDYEVLEPLGTGFSGVVWKAKHRQEGRLVAVKVIEESHYKNHNLLFPPIEEAIHKMLHHPNILRLVDAVLTTKKLERRMYLLTEFVCGGDMFDLSQEPSSEADCKLFTRQILQGVAYLHSCGIVHRDLKVENLLIDENRQLKIADFGLAAFFDIKGIKMIKDYCGSLDYAAPELLREQPYIGPEIDMWAVGVIVYLLKNADFPFEDEEAACNIQCRPWDGVVSEQLQDLVKRLFVPREQKRLTAIEALEHVWFKK